MLLFIQEVSVMRQLDQVCECPDSESIQCALDFENTMNNLETQLYYRHLPPKEVALRVMEAACKFYDADWCGLIQVDLDLGLTAPAASLPAIPSRPNLTTRAFWLVEPP